jgi:hypothetical protein
MWLDSHNKPDAFWLRLAQWLGTLAFWCGLRCANPDYLSLAFDAVWLQCESIAVKRNILQPRARNWSGPRGDKEKRGVQGPGTTPKIAAGINTYGDTPK